VRREYKIKEHRAPASGIAASTSPVRLRRVADAVVPDRQRRRQLTRPRPRSAEKRAQIEADILLARSSPAPLRHDVATPQAWHSEMSRPPSGPPGRTSAPLLVAVRTLVQVHILAGNRACELELDRLQIVDCHGRTVLGFARGGYDRKPGSIRRACAAAPARPARPAPRVAVARIAIEPAITGVDLDQLAAAGLRPDWTMQAASNRYIASNASARRPDVNSPWLRSIKNVLSRDRDQPRLLSG